jgi:galactonate dehydratase
MKVTKIKTFLVNPRVDRTKNWLFVKVETDEGIYGWGECYTQPNREMATELYVKKLGDYFIGHNPFNIKHFIYVSYQDFASLRGSLDFYSAVSGIEQAFWDILGKTLRVPIYNLLGGTFRDKIRIYAKLAKWQTNKELLEEVNLVISQGFTAFKFDPFPGPKRQYISRDEENIAIERVKIVRKTVGDKIDLLIEGHRRLTPNIAIRVAKQFEKYNPFWYEEPVSASNLDLLKEVSRNTTIPIVTGEVFYSKNEFKEVFEKKCAQIINPDIGSCGGIMSLKEISSMAEPYSVAIAPHNYNSTTIALASTLHVCANVPNFIITEYFPYFKKVSDEISINPIVVKNGFIEIPNEPGLGIELDENKLLHYLNK